MFYSDPCSNAQTWAQHAVRATPKGCKLMHFSVTFGTDGSCRTESAYSAPPKRHGDKAATGKVGPGPNEEASHQKGGAKSRRLLWRAHRKLSRQKQLQSAWETLKRAPLNSKNRNDAADGEDEQIEDAAEEASSPPTSHPTPAAEQAAERPPAISATPTTGAATAQNNEPTAQDTSTAAMHTTNLCLPHSHAPPLPPASSKRQKTYVEAAAPQLPIQQAFTGAAVCNNAVSPKDPDGAMHVTAA